MEDKRCKSCGNMLNKSRSVNQNAYMWSVVYGLLSDHLGYAADEIHELMKHKFLGRTLHLNENESYNIPTSTKELDTKAMESYLKQIREWASSDLNVFIPEPNQKVTQ